MRRERTWKALRTLTCLTLVSVVLNCNCGGTSGVRVAEIRAASFRKTVPGSGKIEACEPCYVYPMASGKLTALGVREGDHVQAGQVLASLDRAQLEDDLKKARANYLTEASMGDMMSALFSDMASLSGMFNSTLDVVAYQQQAALSLMNTYGSEVVALTKDLPPEIGETARQLQERMSAEYTALMQNAPKLSRAGGGGYPGSAASADAAREEVALREYEKALERLDNADIRAPVEGLVFFSPMGGLLPEDLLARFESKDGGVTTAMKTVSGGLDQVMNELGAGIVLPQVELKVGSLIKEDRPAFMIVNLERTQVRLKVEEVDVAMVRVGQPVDVTVEALPREVIEGRVVHVAGRPATTLSGVTEYEVTVELDSSGVDLKLGYSASGEITVVDEKGAVLLPLEAVQMEPAPHVFVVRDGRARERNVELGMEDGEKVQVMSGVARGETVVVKGARSLKAGDRI